MIRSANKIDLNKISSLATKTRTNMLDNGLNQWVGDYPNYNNFLSDYKKKSLYVYEENKKILASISILVENEPSYKEIKWNKERSLVIHRIIVDPISQRKKIGTQLFDFAKKLAIKGKFESIKIDTHPDNLKMQGLIKKMQYKYIGYLSGINRLAYELVLLYNKEEVT